MADIDRRTLLQIASSALAAAGAGRGQSHCGASPSAAPAPYQLQFFSETQARLVEDLMERIIPADDHSPGAQAARVIDFSDRMIATGPDWQKQQWQTALNLLAEELKTTPADQWIANASAVEDNPQTPLEKFFRALKRMTVDGYYTSSIGIHDELRYQGNTYVAEFIGCDHPGHSG